MQSTPTSLSLYKFPLKEKYGWEMQEKCLKNEMHILVWAMMTHCKIFSCNYWVNVHQYFVMHWLKTFNGLPF